MGRDAGLREDFAAAHDADFHARAAEVASKG
jgi:hypothetical protein